MIAENAQKSIEQAVCYELQNIVKEHGPVYHSPHEGYAILLEEYQEADECIKFLNNRLECVWHGVKDNDNTTLLSFLVDVKEFALALAEEAIQCAAVCEEFIESVKE